jgi:ATP-dependent Clp protease ATP-binding subunit ClpA
VPGTRVLELSLREALQLGHGYIGTGHILLGLIREGDGVAAQVLVKLDADLNRVRRQAIQLMHRYQGQDVGSTGSRLGEQVRWPSPGHVRPGTTRRGGSLPLPDEVVTAISYAP